MVRVLGSQGTGRWVEALGAEGFLGLKWPRHYNRQTIWPPKEHSDGLFTVTFVELMAQEGSTRHGSRIDGLAGGFFRGESCP